MRRQSGMSCLEVLGIAIVLVAGLMGILPRMREKARQEKCIANLQSIAEAIKFYEDDYDAIMPWGSGGRYGAPGPCNWSDLAEVYVKAVWDDGSNTEDGMNDLLNCPSARQASVTIGQGRTYGYNPYLGKLRRAGKAPAVVPPEVEYPATTMRITETLCPHPMATMKGVEGPFAGTFAPVPDWKAAGLSGPVLAPGWHHGRNNVLWVDGHVSTMTKEQVMLKDSNPDPNVWARLSPKPLSRK